MFTTSEAIFIGLCLEGFFFGLYSAIFFMYLQYQVSKKATDETKNILFYPICILYVLSVAIILLNTYYELIGTWRTIYYVDLILGTIIGCCDFISQSILIYRCWVVWGCNIRLVIIPSILSFIFLATWLAINGSVHLVADQLELSVWGSVMSLTSLAISLTVNALVTGLIVFRIFKVYREVRRPLYDDQTLGPTAGRSKLRPIMFILIESAMALFAVQMVRFVLSAIALVNPAPLLIGNNLMVGINQMLNGITPTIILVRVSMGLSYHDERSMVEATVSLCFAADNPNPNPNPAMGSISIMSQENVDDINIRLSDVER